MRAFVAAVLLAASVQGQPAKPIAGRIRIERIASGATRFAPAEIVAWAGDQIHWFNNTDEPHDPGVLNKDGVFVPFLEQPLAAHATSDVFSPLARIDKDQKMIAFSIQYVCRRHPNEKGTIQVIPTP
jgi:plastocyanin